MVRLATAASFPDRNADADMAAAKPNKTKRNVISNDTLGRNRKKYLRKPFAHCTGRFPGATLDHCRQSVGDWRWHRRLPQLDRIRPVAEASLGNHFYLGLGQRRRLEVDSSLAWP